MSFLPIINKYNTWAAIAVGAISIGVGAVSKSKAKKEAAALEKSTPKYKINPFVDEEIALNKSELANGMSAEASRGYEEGLDKDLSSSLSALLKSGSSLNSVGSLYDNSVVGRQKLAMMREGIRQNQVNNLMNSYRYATDQQDKDFQINQYAPWANKASANAAARQGAENQIWSGIGTAASGAMRGIQSNQAQNDYERYLQSTGGNNGGGNNNSNNYNIQPITAQSGTLQNRNTPNFDVGGGIDYNLGSDNPIWNLNNRPI